MRYIFLSIMLIFFNGCNLKLMENAPKEEYYILDYSSGKKCLDNGEKTLLFIDIMKASSEVDTRFVNVKNGYKYDKINGIKFASLPSEMVRKAIFKAFYSSCKIEPKLVMKNGAYIFKSEILTLQVDKSRNIAIFEMMYSVDKETKSLFSDIKRSEVDISGDNVMDAINKAMSTTLDAILDDIENKF